MLLCQLEIWENVRFFRDIFLIHKSPVSNAAHLIHPLFQRGLKAWKALFEKEGGSIASAIETGDLSNTYKKFIC
jgi:hypothetical protein